MLLTGIRQLLLNQTAITAVLTPAGTVWITYAQKGTQAPFVVLNRIQAPPAGATLDGISALIDGEIQFDAYANDAPTARAITRAIRDTLMNVFNQGTLSDGTTIQFVDVTMDHDEPFEEGGSGSQAYLNRALLRLHAFYTEAA